MTGLYALAVLTADDRLDILGLVAAAAQALDRLDGPGFASMFTDDGVLVAGAEQDWGSAQLTDLVLRAARAGTVLRRHVQTTTMEELSDGFARALSYVLVSKVMPGSRIGISASGVYDDEMTRTPVGWRISRRTVTTDGAVNVMV